MSKMGLLIFHSRKQFLIPALNNKGRSSFLQYLGLGDVNPPPPVSRVNMDLYIFDQFPLIYWAHGRTNL